MNEIDFRKDVISVTRNYDALYMTVIMSAVDILLIYDRGWLFVFALIYHLISIRIYRKRICGIRNIIIKQDRIIEVTKKSTCDFQFDQTCFCGAETDTHCLYPQESLIYLYCNGSYLKFSTRIFNKNSFFSTAYDDEKIHNAIVNRLKEKCKLCLNEIENREYKKKVNRDYIIEVVFIILESQIVYFFPYYICFLLLSL